MKNLLIGTALVFMGIQGTHALNDKEIYDVMMHNLPEGSGYKKQLEKMCKNLNALTQDDKKRVVEITQNKDYIPKSHEYSYARYPEDKRWAFEISDKLRNSRGGYNCEKELG